MRFGLNLTLLLTTLAFAAILSRWYLMLVAGRAWKGISKTSQLIMEFGIVRDLTLRYRPTDLLPSKEYLYGGK